MRKPVQVGKLGVWAYKYQNISESRPVLVGTARAG